MCLVLHISKQGITPLIVKKEPVQPRTAGTKVMGTTVEIVIAIMQRTAFDLITLPKNEITPIDGDTKHHHMKATA